MNSISTINKTRGDPSKFGFFQFDYLDAYCNSDHYAMDVINNNYVVDSVLGGVRWILNVDYDGNV